jgi:hypothetical protein
VVLRFNISVALEQKTANFKVANGSSVEQWSVLTEEKEMSQLAKTNWFLKKNNNNKGGGKYSWSFASTSALHCSRRREIFR